MIILTNQCKDIVDDISEVQNWHKWWKK